MSRPLLLLLGLAIFAGLVIQAQQGSRPRPPARPQRPHLLLVSVDTLRPDRLSCYGHDRPTSPHIDALARRGVLFEQAYSHSPKTAISHMSLLTGLHPPSHGVVQADHPEARRLSPEIPTLPALLSRHGYRTVAITGGGHVIAELGFDAGVEAFRVVQWLPAAVDAAIAEIDRLRHTAPEEPFYLFLHTYAVHDPYLPPEPFREGFVDPSYSGGMLDRPQELTERAGDAWEDRHRVYWEHVDRDDPGDLRHLLDLYDAGIRFADHHLGRLLGHLDLTGLARDTLVVLVSDHGEEFREHGGFLHERVYQETLRVPLILAIPGERGEALRGHREPSVVRLVDLLPTLLDLLELPVPGHVQGRSLLPRLAGEPAPEPEVMSSWERDAQRALRIGRWKLVSEGEGERARQRLFDLDSDPGEQRDLARAEPEKRAELGRELRRRRREARAFQAGVEAGTPAELDAAARERLEQLGYLR